MARCHVTKSFTSALEGIGCELVFIPAGLTGML